MVIKHGCFAKLAGRWDLCRIVGCAWKGGGVGVCARGQQEKEKEQQAEVEAASEAANKQTNKNLRCGNRKGLLSRNDQTHHRMGPKTMESIPPSKRNTQADIQKQQQQEEENAGR